MSQVLLLSFEGSIFLNDFLEKSLNTVIFQRNEVKYLINEDYKLKVKIVKKMSQKTSPSSWEELNIEFSFIPHLS